MSFRCPDRQRRPHLEGVFSYFGNPGCASGIFPSELKKVIPMLRWALIFLVIGLIAGVLGFTGVAGASIAIAKTLFFIFMLIFLVLLIAGLTVARKVGGG
jgi:uncharacterized membrane protein YtjA (UPF0391 family)